MSDGVGGLLNQLDDVVEGMMVRAVDVFIDEIVQDRVTPEDTGKLKRGIKPTFVGFIRSGDVVSAVVQSTALSDTGFDYPKFQNATYHEGWWRKVTSQSRWFDAVKRVQK